MTKDQEKEIAIKGDEWASTKTSDRGGYYFAGLSEGYYNGYIAGATEATKELQEQIEKMKCCENCKHHGYMGNELICHLSTIEEENDCIKSKKYWEWWRS